ncbi:MAG TPA: PDZ domain-containing protein [Minicystis sp.]|nr:PDZ domain-containing protein [Minicystis sp.]
MLLVALALVVLNFALVRGLRVVVHRMRGVTGARFLGPEPEPFDVPVKARLSLAGAAVASACAIVYVLGALSAVLSPRPVATTTVTVAPGRAADRAGLRDGDRVVSIAGRPVAAFDDIAPIVRAHPGEAIPVEVERGGAPLTLTVTPGAPGAPDAGKIGVGAVMGRGPIDPVDVATRGVVLPYQYVRGMAALVFARAHATELSGPVAIVSAARSSSGAPGVVAVACVAIAAWEVLALVFIAPLAFWSASRRPGK